MKRTVTSPFTSPGQARSIGLRALAVMALMAIGLAGPTAGPVHGKTAVDVRSVSTRAAPNAVIAWNANVREASIAACSIGGAGPAEARMFAMAHLAIHDALNGIDRHSHPYAARPARATVDVPDAAVAAAAHGALVPTLSHTTILISADCVEAGIASVEADYADAIDAIPDGRAKNAGHRS